MEEEPETKVNGQATLSPRTDHQDPKQSLRHILTITTEPAPKSKPRSPQDQTTPVVSANEETSSKKAIIWIDGEAQSTEEKEDINSVQNDSYTRAAEFNPSHTMTVAHTRRNANGTIGSVYSGNKIRHLKKEDGIPLWRKDIQLEFLRCVFEDTTPVFTKAYDGTQGHTFADIYIDAMARSSKTSKILKDKLLADHGAAMHMAMICLLVNVGRMNTTLNFFPEMRAQLRTYHSIPSLQANRDPNAYKQLQDAPRLKSILKGASEDANQPGTIEKIKAAPIPRTNPVNLIFVLSQYAPKVSEVHFDPPRDFFDLVMRSTLSSKSRARSFLWLIWYYLESDFSAEMALQSPFGPGRAANDGEEPFKVPSFEHLTEAQADAENVDTEEEKVYGEMKRQERIRILQEDETVGPPLKKMKKNPTEELGIIAISDNDARSPSPNSAIHLKPKYEGYDGPSISTNGNGPTGTPSVARFAPPLSRSDSNPQRLVLKTRMGDYPPSSSPAPPGSGHPIYFSTNSSRRPRPETSHQKAVNINRKMRIDHILHNKIRDQHNIAREERSRHRSSFGLMVMNRIKDLPVMYDTDDEYSWGPGGLMPNRKEPEDFGEEAFSYKKAIDRAMRRLYREENEGALDRNFKRLRKRRYSEDDEKDGRSRKRRRDDGSRMGLDGKPLDALDLALLGEGPESDEMDESEMDDSDMSMDEPWGAMP